MASSALNSGISPCVFSVRSARRGLLRLLTNITNPTTNRIQSTANTTPTAMSTGLTSAPVDLLSFAAGPVDEVASDVVVVVSDDGEEAEVVGKSVVVVVELARIRVVWLVVVSRME